MIYAEKHYDTLFFMFYMELAIIMRAKFDACKTLSTRTHAPTASLISLEWYKPKCLDYISYMTTPFKIPITQQNFLP